MCLLQHPPKQLEIIELRIEIYSEKPRKDDNQSRITRHISCGCQLHQNHQWMERDEIGEAHMFCRGVAFAATVQHAREKLKPSKNKMVAYAELMQNFCETYAPSFRCFPT
jgi:hypothetical protein